MKVVLVGAGPGDPGLLTLKGRDELAAADVVVYDALANPDLLAYARPGAELVYVGKIAGRHALPQNEINALLASKALAGKTVVRLKGGDPYIFGRGGEEAEYLAARDIPFEEVPGISSAIAAPAYAGIPLTHRDMTSSVTIVTGHENPDKDGSSHNWRALAATGSTLVFVMGMKNLEHIVENLLKAGMEPQMPAALIYRGTTPMQRSLASTLAELPQKAQAAGFSNPAVIVVGHVVSLHATLDWFSRKPLLGRNIVVTRAREQASSLAGSLCALGANVLECPTIAIEPLADYAGVDNAIEHLSSYDWVIFTSVNGVKFFWQRLYAAGLDSRRLPKVAAIGPATAEALRSGGINADLQPDTYVAEAVAETLIARTGGGMDGMRILLPRAARARAVLPQILQKAGATVDVLPVYETHPGSGCGETVIEMLSRGGIDCVTFGSSSTVENFLDIIPAGKLLEHPETALAVIGPVTGKTLQKHGLAPTIMPKDYTIPGLVAAIGNYYGGSMSTGGKQCP